jgi:hypothetical protein
VPTSFAGDCLSANIKLFTAYMSESIIICFADYVHWLKLLVHPLRINKSLWHNGIKISFDVIYEAMKLGGFGSLSIAFDMCPNDQQKVAPLLRVLADWVIVELRGFGNDATFPLRGQAAALADFFANVRSAFECFDIKRTLPTQYNDLLHPKPVKSLNDRSLELQRILVYLEGVVGQTRETMFATRLNVSSFIKLLASLSPRDLELLKPRILGSDFCETFFSILKAHYQRFAVWQFAQAFGMNDVVVESEMAGFHATGIVAVSNKSRNNFISDLHDQDAGLMIPKEAVGHLKPLTRTIRPKLTLEEKFIKATNNREIALVVRALRDGMNPDLFAKRNTHSIRASYHRQTSGTVRDNSFHLAKIEEEHGFDDEDEDENQVGEEKKEEQKADQKGRRVERIVVRENYFFCPIREAGCTHNGFAKRDGQWLRSHTARHFRNLTHQEFEVPYKEWLLSKDPDVSWDVVRYPPHNIKVD